MSHWLDEKLAEQSLRDRQQRDKAERESRQADAVRTKLPEYMAALGEHIQTLLNRYNEANVGHPDREMLYTRDADGGFGVGTTGISSAVRAVYCIAKADIATISVEWRPSSDSDPSKPKEVDLSVMIRRDGKVIVSDGVSKYTDIDALARFLLVPVFFPEHPDQEPTRRVSLDEGEDEPF
jgi:hypothetical protein